MSQMDRIITQTASRGAVSRIRCVDTMLMDVANGLNPKVYSLVLC